MYEMSEKVSEDKCGVIKIKGFIFQCRCCKNGNLLQAGQNTQAIIIA